MEKIKKGTVYVFPKGGEVYYVRTPDELKDLYAADQATGNTLNSAGESLIHNRQGSIRFVEPTTVMIVGLTRAEWHSWYNKPVGLVRAVVTSGPNIGRQVSVTKKVLLGTQNL